MICDSRKHLQMYGICTHVFIVEMTVYRLLKPPPHSYVFHSVLPWFRAKFKLTVSAHRVYIKIYISVCAVSAKNAFRLRLSGAEWSFHNLTLGHSGAFSPRHSQLGTRQLSYVPTIALHVWFLKIAPKCAINLLSPILNFWWAFACNTAEEICKRG